MGLYSKMGSARSGGGGNHWTEGDYLARILKHSEHESQNDKGFFVAIECKVVHVLRSVGEKIWPHNNNPKMPPSKTVGETVSQVVFFSGPGSKSAMGNLKNFIIGASGLTEAEIVQMHCLKNSIDPNTVDDAIKDAVFEELAERVFGDGGEMYAGTLVHVRGQPVPKKDKNPFTKVLYSAPTAEQLATAGFDAEGNRVAETAS